MTAAGDFRRTRGVWQLQAFRGGAWHHVSGHVDELNARRALKKMAKCQPQFPEHFRVIHRSDRDRFIYFL